MKLFYTFAYYVIDQCTYFFKRKWRLWSIWNTRLPENIQQQPNDRNTYLFQNPINNKSCSYNISSQEEPYIARIKHVPPATFFKAPHVYWELNLILVLSPSPSQPAFPSVWHRAHRPEPWELPWLGKGHLVLILAELEGESKMVIYHLICCPFDLPYDVHNPLERENLDARRRKTAIGVLDAPYQRGFHSRGSNTRSSDLGYRNLYHSTSPRSTALETLWIYPSVGRGGFRILVYECTTKRRGKCIKWELIPISNTSW